MTNNLITANDSWRNDQDLSIRETSEKICISHVCLVRIINGLTEIPALVTLSQVAKAMNIDLAYLVELLGYSMIVDYQPNLAILLGNGPWLVKLLLSGANLNLHHLDDLNNFAVFSKSG